MIIGLGIKEQIQYDAKKATDKLELVYLNPQANIEDIKNVCEQAKAQNYVSVCIPQWFVSFAKETLKESGVKVSTIVGLPGGTTSRFAKYAEVKEAIKNGVDEVVIPMNMALIENNDMPNALIDLAEAMIPAKGKATVAALIENNIVSEEKLNSAIDVAISSGLEYIMISNVQKGANFTTQQAKELTARMAGKAELRVLGNVINLNLANSMLESGV